MSLPLRNPTNPDGWVMPIGSDVPLEVADMAAQEAAALAREMAPRVSGQGARGLTPAFGDGWIGIWSRQSHMLHVNEGTRPRIMTELAGKTIPMWVNDRDGSMTESIPLAKRAERTRVTEDGRRQVKIFRKAAPIGSTKIVPNARGRLIQVPRAYPGARKRVSGRFAGRYWRHPGISGQQFVQDALELVASEMRFDADDVYLAKIGA